MNNKKFIEDVDFDFDDEKPGEQEQKKEIQTSKPQRESNESAVTKNINHIQSKPKVEIKKEEENPYKDRYLRNNTKNQKNQKNQKNSTTKTDNVAKKLISISQKNTKVLTILKHIGKDYPSESEFICQAIIEKFERENNNEKVDIKDLVKNALNELVGEKYIVLKGSSEINITNGYLQNPQVEVPSINKAIEDKEEEEKKDLLLAMLSNLEEDEEDYEDE